MSQENTELQQAEKQELQQKEEKTVPGKYYMPRTDIHETKEALVVTMDMPGVTKESVKIRLENNVLNVDGQIDSKRYEGLTPMYTEYNVGHFTRQFSLSNQIDQGRIEANMADGVLTLNLPKAPEAQPKQIQVS